MAHSKNEKCSINHTRKYDYHYMFLYFSRKDLIYMNNRITFEKETSSYNVCFKEVDKSTYTILYKNRLFKTLEEAKKFKENKQNSYIKDIEHCKSKINVKYTFTEYIDRWLKEILPSYSTSPAYITTANWAINQVFLPRVTKDLLLSKVTPAYINSILKKCQDTHHKSVALQPKNICHNFENSGNGKYAL